MTSCDSDVGAFSAASRRSAFWTWALLVHLRDVTHDLQRLSLLGQAARPPADPAT